MCITKMIFIFPAALNPPLLRRWPFAAWRRIDRLQSSAGWRKNRAEMRWISTRIPSDAILLCSSVTLAQSVTDPTKRKKTPEKKMEKIIFWGEIWFVTWRSCGPIRRLAVQQVQLPGAADTAIMVAHESMPSLVEWKRIKMSFGGATVSPTSILTPLTELEPARTNCVHTDSEKWLASTDRNCCRFLWHHRH